MTSKQYCKLSFSAVEDEHLIQEVKDHPPLYSKKLKTYKDVQIKENIWKHIAATFAEKKTGEDCKKRWANLRDYYMKKKKKLGTGSTASKDREHLDQFRFLEGTNLPHRSTVSNVAATTVHISDSQGTVDTVETSHEMELENDIESDEETRKSQVAAATENNASLVVDVPEYNSLESDPGNTSN